MHTSKSIWILAIFYCLNLHANTINIPADYNTIQEGINAANTGDTVLVQPGAYTENISFMGKNIVVASLFLTTSDTSYISQTIIDGNSSNSVVRFEYMETSSAKLTGFTITNGLNTFGGGGILCFAYSNPTLENLVISGNTGGGGGGILCFGYANPTLNNVTMRNNVAVLYGGGIHCEFLSSPVLNNVMITNNICYQHGGGAYFLDSCFASINNSIIKDNFAESNGGGIGCENTSDIYVNNSEISNNFANINGGGVYILQASPRIDFSRINFNKANDGAGIFSHLAQNSIFRKVTIDNNKAFNSGAGIRAKFSQLSMAKVTIRDNHALVRGGGIFCDTSTFSFDAEKRCNIYLNFAGYEGNDLINTDISSFIPVILDTFTVANFPAGYQSFPENNFLFDVLHAKVQTTTENLFVAPGGSNENDGLTSAHPLKTLAYALTKAAPEYPNSQKIILSGGFYSTSANAEHFPINMKDNIKIEGVVDSVVIFDAEDQSSVFAFYTDREVSIKNLIITGGSSDYGGGIYCYNSNPFLERVTIYRNTADLGGGIYCENNSSPYIFNSTITRNFTSDGGGFYGNNDSPTLVNSILWDNYPQEISFYEYSDSAEITIAYSNIKNGEGGINANTSTYIHWLPGNLDLDPLFVDTSEYNFSLKDSSDCINSGIQDSIIEFDGGHKSLHIPAINYCGTAPDLGAWECHEIIDNRKIIDPNNPIEFTLFQNYPNPFNPKTKIDFILPKPGKVTIHIYNSIGQLVETLIDTKLPKGKKSVYFDGSKYSSDVYFYQIKSGKYNRIKKMLLIK